MAVAIGSPTRATPGKRPWWDRVFVVLIAMGVAALLVALGLNVWITNNPPVSKGAFVGALGNAEDCDPMEFGSDASLICYEVPFDEGAGVGIGFTVRNTAPIPMTILSIDPLEAPFQTPAYLHPELLETLYIFGLDIGRPFEPIEVAPGEELPIQLVGTYRACEAVAQEYIPGSALILDHAHMRVRWAFFETEVDVPFGATLSLPAPDACPG